MTMLVMLLMNQQLANRCMYCEHAHCVLVCFGSQSWWLTSVILLARGCIQLTLPLCDMSEAMTTAGIVSSALGKKVPVIKKTGDAVSDYMANQQRDALVEVIDLLTAKPQHRSAVAVFARSLVVQETKKGLSAIGATFAVKPQSFGMVDDEPPH